MSRNIYDLLKFFTIDHLWVTWSRFGFHSMKPISSDALNIGIHFFHCLLQVTFTQTHKIEIYNAFSRERSSNDTIQNHLPDGFVTLCYGELVGNLHVSRILGECIYLRFKNGVNQSF